MKTLSEVVRISLLNWNFSEIPDASPILHFNQTFINLKILLSKISFSVIQISNDKITQRDIKAHSYLKDHPMGHRTYQLICSDKHFITGGLILTTAQTKLVQLKCYFSPGGLLENVGIVLLKKG